MRVNFCGYCMIYYDLEEITYCPACGSYLQEIESNPAIQVYTLKESD